jgi:hypothetical protein
MKWLVAATALALAGPAFAGDVRDFAPDRPSRSDSPFTVPDGFVQFESDLVNYTHTGQILQSLDPTFKYGLTNLTDIEVQLGGLISQQNGSQTAEGFGDVTVRAKFNLVGDDGGAVTAALIPYIKIPTAPAPIGNGQVEGGVNAPLLFALPYSFSLTIEPEIAVLKNALNDGKQASFSGVANLGRNIFGNLSGFVEIYDQTYTDRAAKGPNVTFDYGLAYLVTPAIQLDAGANVGLNRSTPSLNVYTGIAFRF